MVLTFSPDGSQIAYTVFMGTSFATVTISALGGDPHLFLTNAAALTWLDADKILFSHVRSGLHMGIVTARSHGDHMREIYYPPHERAMAHYSFASPDRTSALVVEMDGNGEWDQCRLISLESLPAPTCGARRRLHRRRLVPRRRLDVFHCTVEGQSHLWRQRFPNGQAQQITFGPTEEDGLAVERMATPSSPPWACMKAPYGSTMNKGERPVSSEGEIVSDLTPPTFTADDQSLYYLTLHQPTEPGAGALAPVGIDAAAASRSSLVFT